PADEPARPWLAPGAAVDEHPAARTAITVSARSHTRNALQPVTLAHMTYDSGSGMGANFYLRIAALCLVCGIAFVVIALVFWKTLVAWGIVGFFALFALVAFIGSWIVDKRRPTELS